jgi:hypothetical protein
VFEEHYIEVPESKIDLVDEMTTRIEDLEEQLNSEQNRNISISEENKSLLKDKIVRDASHGLSEAQAEKLKGLVEDVDFEDADTFEDKVATIKESYFKEAQPEVVAEDTEVTGETEEVQVSPMMERYLQAMRNANK